MKNKLKRLMVVMIALISCAAKSMENPPLLYAPHSMGDMSRTTAKWAVGYPLLVPSLLYNMGIFFTWSGLDHTQKLLVNLRNRRFREYSIENPDRAIHSIRVPRVADPVVGPDRVVEVIAPPGGVSVSRFIKVPGAFGNAANIVKSITKAGVAKAVFSGIWTYLFLKW